MKKNLIHTTIFFGIIISLILTLRIINNYRFNYQDTDSSGSYYSDPSNISLYPQDHGMISIKHIDEGRVQGFHLLPNDIKKKGVVIVYGGSDGTPGYEQAIKFAENGYETLALFMFGQNNLQPTLSKIPLEQFEEVLKYVDKNVTDKTTITLFGASKGAEYALNLATKYDEIDNLILMSPAAYNFNGLDFEDFGSSWTFEGRELNYVDVMKSSFSVYIWHMMIPMLIGSPISYSEIYNSAIANDMDIDKKIIPVNDTNANILMIVGSDDKMWDSRAMAETIKTHRSKNTTIEVYEGAGHAFGAKDIIKNNGNLVHVGGSEERNKESHNKSQKLMLEQLNKWHMDN